MIVPRISEAEEFVVLLSEDRRPIGTMAKALVHSQSTPFHLAFSCYVFDSSRRLLLTRRSRRKRTWPGVWSNSFCGHPSPGEPVEHAVMRRAQEELGICPSRLRLALPDFAYRASYRGVVEYEWCPVYICTFEGEPCPNDEEVEAWKWMPWQEVVTSVSGGSACGLSPWCVEQVGLLDMSGAVHECVPLRPY